MSRCRSFLPDLMTVRGARGNGGKKTVAALARGCDVLSFDILLDESMDLLRDDSYEQLLRICSSGQVGYGSASPACSHYSRLKLRPGPDQSVAYT